MLIRKIIMLFYVNKRRQINEKKKIHNYLMENVLVKCYITQKHVMMITGQYENPIDFKVKREMKSPNGNLIVT